MKFSTLFFLNALIGLAGAASIPQPEGLVERLWSQYVLAVCDFICNEDGEEMKLRLMQFQSIQLLEEQNIKKRKKE
jgi:hypothetical protein